MVYLIVGVTSFQKIYGLYSVEHHIMEKWSYYVGFGWVLWVWWVCVGDGGVGSGSVNSGCHQLSENIWFVCFKMSYSGDMEGCHACGRTDDGQRTCGK